MSNYQYRQGQFDLLTLGAQASVPDGSGDIVVTHNMQKSPHVVLCQLTETNNYTLAVHARSTTTFTVRVYDADTGSAVTSGTVDFDWLAY